MIDTHAHLDALEDAEAAVARAREAGVTRIISIGTDPVSWADTLDLIEAHEDVYGVVGLHPHEATLTFDLSALPRLLGHPKIVGRRRDRPRLLPRLCAARRAGEAVHLPARPCEGGGAPRRDPQSRGGRGHGLHPRQWFDGTVVLHCFSSVALLDEAIEQGWYVSFAGNVTYKNADDLRSRRVPCRPSGSSRRRTVPTSHRSPSEGRRTSRRTSSIPSRLSPKPAAKTRKHSARRSMRTPTRRSACHERSREEEARPALPRRREHPRRDRPPRRARRRRRRARGRARARRADQVSRRPGRAGVRGGARRARSRRS